MGEYPCAIFSAVLIDNLWTDYGESTRGSGRLSVVGCQFEADLWAPALAANASYGAAQLTTDN